MTEWAATLERSPIGRWFRFEQNGTTLARDTMAGVTTFIVMSYIIFVNPAILGFAGVEGLEGAGLPFDAVLTSTCLVAGVMTIIMGLYTNMAYAIAPGLGLNAVVAFTLVADNGLGFPEAMGFVVIEGLAITILVVLGLREAITIVGLLVTIGLRAIGFPGDLLVGIILTTVFATIVNYAADVYPENLGYARWPDDIVQSPDFSLVGDISFDAFSTLPFIAALALVFTLFLADFFDTMGTLVGVGRQAGYLDERGEMPEIQKPLLVDSAAAAVGGFASASSATTYIESASGVGVGGRTGWVSVVTGLLFFPFMFVAPLIGMVPPQATAPALLIVAWLMISVLTEVEEEAEAFETGRVGAEEGTTAQPATTTRRERYIAGINFHDLALGFGAAIMIMLMPFSFSITDGIAAGFIVYVLVRAFQGAWATVHPLMWAAALAFAIYFAIPIMQQEFGWI